MPEKEKRTVETLKKAVSVLPEGKVEYLLGYAEGAVAAAEKKHGGQDCGLPHDQPTNNAS